MTFEATSSLPNLVGARVLITGASGWLGQEALCLLSKTHSKLDELDLTLIGSQRRRIDIHGTILETTPIADTFPQEKFDIILHFAFSTQDKAIVQGATNYIEGNLRLNKWIAEVALNNFKAKKLILSSGAVDKFSKSTDKQSSMKIYADLKRELENEFTDHNSLILRLWNTSGHHMGANKKYALGEFITSALHGEPIAVGKNLKRTFVAASSILEASISYLLDDGHGLVNSGGEKIALHELAKKTIEVLGSRSSCQLEDPNSYPELDYVSPASEIPIEYWSKTLDLNEQISNTASGICK